ncbi:cell division protein FtsQ/DivIB [Sinomonas atrocyanea]|uniref:cell division protein FtsQ/DivIB n=1 Tax=Sinomonas atrocyanea TaxID=37927 RepID=UPI0028624575|nr:cell division protein FtsQ/DivIB [Sinomonas atrocyanea]MDR6620076.1 cell division protein FtsQ [Sinomonas atrocyanea]
MAPSGRIPRVPRVPGRDDTAGGRPGREPQQPSRERPAPPASPGAAHDAGRPPSSARVTVRSGPKVTLLGSAEPDPSAGDSDAGAPPADAAPAHDGPAPRKRPRPALSELSALAGLRRTQDPARPPDGSADVLAFPEPPRRRRRRRLLLAAAIAAALVAGLFAVLLFTPLVAVRSITVQGTHLLTVQQVEGALAPVRGRPLATVGTDEVGRLLGQFVQVKSVRARAVPPETLVVEVVERVPVALVKQGQKLLVVDGDGVVLGEARDTSQYAVPVIDGSAMPMGQAVFKAVTAVLAALPSDVLAQLATASAQSPDSVQLKLADGRSVVWGNADDRELKAKVLAALMKASTTPQKGQSPVQVFDVSTPRHPVTR